MRAPTGRRKYYDRRLLGEVPAGHTDHLLADMDASFVQLVDGSFVPVPSSPTTFSSGTPSRRACRETVLKAQCRVSSLRPTVGCVRYLSLLGRAAVAIERVVRACLHVYMDRGAGVDVRSASRASVTIICGPPALSKLSAQQRQLKKFVRDCGVELHRLLNRQHMWSHLASSRSSTALRKSSAFSVRAEDASMGRFSVISLPPRTSQPNWSRVPREEAGLFKKPMTVHRSCDNYPDTGGAALSHPTITS